MKKSGNSLSILVVVNLNTILNIDLGDLVKLAGNPGRQSGEIVIKATSAKFTYTNSTSKTWSKISFATRIVFKKS